MAHSHYVLDLYYTGDGPTDAPRREVLRIEAHNDAEAIEEGIRVSGWRHPLRFDVRAITNSARTRDRLLHTATTVREAPLLEAPVAGRAEVEGSA